MPPTRRMQRINQLLRDEISELLRREIKDESLTTPLLSITDVDTAPDMRSARVYFSVYGDAEVIQETQRHLDRAAAFLRRNLMERLDLRYTPKLQFVFDESLAQGARIMSLMRDIEAARGDGDDGDDGDDAPPAEPASEINSAPSEARADD